MVGPNSAEHGPDKTEKRRETNYAVSHVRERVRRWFCERARKHAADHVNDSEHAGEKHGRVTGGNRDDVSCQPDVCVEHRLQHLKRVAASGEMVRNDQCDETDRSSASSADSVPENPLQDE